MRYIGVLLLFFCCSFAQVQWPALNRPVVDEAGWLSDREQLEIENVLLHFRNEGKGQVQVVIVSNLQGIPIESYTIQLVERWKIGNKKRDDGVLFLVSAEDRKMRIEVGQGFEGVLTDIQTKRILDDRVRPLFKAGEYASGIAAGVSEIVSAIDPAYEFAPSRPARIPVKDEGESYLFWIILFLIIISNVFGRRRRGWIPFIGGYSMGRHSGGGWSGGGGWTGGGGGFSGGGASSDW